MSDAGLTRDEVRLALAERLSVPCDCGCHATNVPHSPRRAGNDWREDCPGCGGTGRLWPLREPCLCVGLIPGTPECQHCEARGWGPKDWHLEDLLWIWVERDCDPWSFVSLISPFPDTPDGLLEAGERAFLKALPK